MSQPEWPPPTWPPPAQPPPSAEPPSGPPPAQPPPSAEPPQSAPTATPVPRPAPTPAAAWPTALPAWPPPAAPPGGAAPTAPAWSPPAPAPTTPAPGPHTVGTGVFARVHVRWLLLVAVIGLIGLVIAVAVVERLARNPLADDELFSILLYVPLVAWVGYVVMRHGVRLRPFFALPRIGRYWWVVAGMAVALFAFSIGASNVTAALFPDFVASANVSTGAGAGVLFISLVVVPPVVEETIFRGMLLERWAVKWRLGVAVVVQAVCFGILHVDPVGAGVFGVVLALVYLRTRTLWVPIAMHAANNGVVLLAVLLVGDAADSADDQQSLGEAIGTGVVFMALSLPFIVWFIRRNWPTAQTLTPYEEFEHGPGALPPRHVGPVRVLSGPGDTAGAKGRLWFTLDSVVVTRDRAGRQVLTGAPYAAITSVSVTEDYRTIGMRAADGSGVLLALPQRSVRIRTGILRALGDRTLDVTGVAPGWLPAQPA